MTETTIDAVDMLSDAAGEYANEVIMHRAIPSLSDGLKPVQRRALYQLSLSKLEHNSKPDSLSTVAGATLKWHPHGDGSVESTLTNMYRPWLNRAPFVEIQGNAGSTEKGPAAARYIKVRKTRVSDLITNGLSKTGVVSMIPNFDGTAEEPLTLPAAIPVALVNGTRGIAWGMGSNITQHNPIELLRGCQALVNNPDTSTDELLSIIPGPDFATGCVIVGRDGSRDEMDTGRAQFTVRGRVREIEHPDYPDSRVMEIYQIPPGIQRAKIIDQLGKALEPYAHYFKFSDSINDASTSGNVSILIAVDKSVDDTGWAQLESLVFSKTALESKLTVNNNLVHKGTALTYSIRDYLLAFLDYRREILRRIHEYDVNEQRHQRDITDAQLWMINNADVVTRIASESTSRDDMRQTLANEYGLNDAQTEFIAQQPLYKLSKRQPGKIEFLNDKLSSLNSSIDKLETILSEHDAFEQSLLDDLSASIKFLGEENYPRLTEIVDATDELAKLPDVKMDESAAVESKPVTVVVGHDLTLRRIGQKAFTNQHADNQERIAAHVDTTTDSYVACITQTGKMIIRLVNDIPHHNLADDIEPMNRQTREIDSNDRFIAVVPISGSNWMVTVSRDGSVKRMNMNTIAPSLKTRAYVNKSYPVSGLKKGTDELAYALFYNEDESVPESIHVELSNGTKNRTVDITNKVMERDDSGRSSGARAVYVKKNETIIGCTF